MDISKTLLEKGAKFYKVGGVLIKVLLASLALFALIMIIGIIGWGTGSCLYILTVYTRYTFVDILIVISYLGIVAGLVGLPFFFFGLHYMGLGQIAINTEPKNY